MNRKQRRALAALATSATLSAIGVVGSFAPAGSVTIGPLPPVTTLPPPTIPGGLLPTTTTAPSPTTSTTVAPTTTTTTTTVPVDDDGGPVDDTPTTTDTSSGNRTNVSVGETGVAPAKNPLPVGPNVPATVAGAVGVAAPVGSALAAVPAQHSALRSPVLVGGPVQAAFPAPLGGRSTRSVLDILFGMDVSPVMLGRVVAPFPVAGPATYSNDWQAPRTAPEFHLHEGTDVFAATGTPVVASADGVVSLSKDTPVGGNAVHVTERDGTYYYYAHLEGFATGLDDGTRVQKGDIIGFVGSTGNAEGGAPHLHFEIHPKGGAAVPPVPYLDRWLREAEATASTLRSQPVAAGSLVQLQPKSKGSAARNALLAPAASQRPLPEGATRDPSVGMGVSVGTLALLWLGRRFKRRVEARRAG